MYSVLIADDERLVREDIKLIFNEEGLPLALAGEARDGRQAHDMACSLAPDIVVVDIRMPAMNGIELMKSLRPRFPGMQFIIVSGFAEFEYARDAISLGVAGYVLKPIRNADLAAAVRRACAEIEAARGTRQESDVRRRLEEANGAMLMEQHLNDLLLDAETEPPPALAERLRALRACRCVLAVFHVGNPHAGGSAEEAFIAARAAARAAIERACRDGAILFSSRAERNELLVLFPDRSEQRALAACDRLVGAVMGAPAGTAGLAVGVSGVGRSIDCIAHCHEEAAHALCRRFTDPDRRVYRGAGTREPGREPPKLPEGRLRVLGLLLEHPDSGTFPADVRAAVADVFSPDTLAGATPASLQLLFSEVISLVTRFCDRMGLNILAYVDERTASGEVVGDFTDGAEAASFAAGLIEAIRAAALTPPPDADSLVRLVREDMRDHYHMEMTLESTARRHGIGAKHLSRIFKAATGASFIESLTDLRMVRAKELLSTTHMSIQDVASAAGYADHQYFHRVFKRCTGLTPNEYRQGTR